MAENWTVYNEVEYKNACTKQKNTNTEGGGTRQADHRLGRPKKKKRLAEGCNSEAQSNRTELSGTVKWRREDQVYMDG